MTLDTMKQAIALLKTEHGIEASLNIPATSRSLWRTEPAWPSALATNTTGHQYSLRRARNWGRL